MGKRKDALQAIEEEVLRVDRAISYYSGPGCNVEHGLAAHAIAMFQQYRDGLLFALNRLQ